MILVVFQFIFFPLLLSTVATPFWTRRGGGDIVVKTLPPLPVTLIDPEPLGALNVATHGWAKQSGQRPCCCTLIFDFSLSGAAQRRSPSQGCKEREGHGQSRLSTLGNP